MTEEQTKYLMDLIEQQSDEVFLKFSNGVKEHGGGNIWEVPLLDLVKEAKNEANDQYVYLYTIEKILNLILKDPYIKLRVQEILKLEKLVQERKDV